MGAALAVLVPILGFFALAQAFQRGPSHAPDEQLRQEAERAEAARQMQEEQLRRQAAESHQRAVELARQADEQRRQAEEHARRAEEDFRRQAEQLQQALEEQRRQHAAEAAQLEHELEQVARARAEEQRRTAELQAQIAREWPRPAWLPQSGVHFGVTGRSGVGKSTLVNAIRGKRPGEPGAAPVGVTETTMQPVCYRIEDGPLAGLCIWDLPGAGTMNFPAAEYIKRFGLRYFSGLLIANSGRFEELDLALFHEACTWALPSYLVRTKADSDILENEADHGLSPQETLDEIRGYVLREAGRSKNYPVTDASRLFVVTGKVQRYAEVLQPELERLLRLIGQDLQRAWQIVGETGP